MVFGKNGRWKNVRSRDVDRVDLGADDNYKPERFQAATQKVDGLIKRVSEGYESFKDRLDDINERHGKKIRNGLIGAVLGAGLLLTSYNIFREGIEKIKSEVAYVGNSNTGNFINYNLFVPKSNLPGEKLEKYDVFLARGVKLPNGVKGEVYVVNFSENGKLETEIYLSDYQGSLKTKICLGDNEVYAPYLLTSGDKVDQKDLLKYLKTLDVGPISQVFERIDKEKSVRSNHTDFGPIDVDKFNVLRKSLNQLGNGNPLN